MMDNSQRAIKADSPLSHRKYHRIENLPRAPYDVRHGKKEGLPLDSTWRKRGELNHISSMSRASAGVRGRPDDLPNPPCPNISISWVGTQVSRRLELQYHPGTAPRGGKERKREKEGGGKGYDVLSGCSTRTLLHHSASPTQITISIS